MRYDVLDQNGDTLESFDSWTLANVYLRSWETDLVKGNIRDNDSGDLMLDRPTATCEDCGRTFPDVFPSARCPYEGDHEYELEDEDEETGVGEHIILVAFDVRGDTRGEAEAWLYAHLPNPSLQRGLECWWVAEDDRRDGSDNHSAVFVTPGRKEDAYRVLLEHGLTREPDYTTWTPRAQAQRAAHEEYMRTH